MEVCGLGDVLSGVELMGKGGGERPEGTEGDMANRGS